MPLNLAALAGGFAEHSGELLLGFGVGTALSEALHPEAVEIGQIAWEANPVRAVEPGTAAGIVAESVERRDWGAAEAVKSGIDGDRFDAMVGEVLNAPGFPELLETWRRNLIDDAAFEHGLRKLKLEAMWDAPLHALKERLLDPEQLANMRQQGFIEPARQIEESGLQGVNAERAELLFDIVGLPPGAETAMAALNRGLADKALFAQMIREGHTKTKYTALLEQMARSLNTPSEYAELRLRGWINDGEMRAGGALQGRNAADMDLLFKLHGRPIPIHQVTTGEARGGKYNGPTADIPIEFLRSMEEGSARSEWYDLMYANRYTYPSAFVMRSLAQSGAVTETETHTDLLHIGWRPDLAAKVAAEWHKGTTAKTDPHVTKADTHLWTALHSSYVKEESDEAAITPGLQMLGVADIAGVLSRWNAERALIHAQLTPAQIKKAAKTLPAVWPRQRALDALLARGYTADEAATLLDE